MDSSKRPTSKGTAGSAPRRFWEALLEGNRRKSGPRSTRNLTKVDSGMGSSAKASPKKASSKPAKGRRQRGQAQNEFEQASVKPQRKPERSAMYAGKDGKRYDEGMAKPKKAKAAAKAKVSKPARKPKPRRAVKAAAQKSGFDFAGAVNSGLRGITPKNYGETKVANMSDSAWRKAQRKAGV